MMSLGADAVDDEEGEEGEEEPSPHPTKPSESKTKELASTPLESQLRTEPINRGSAKLDLMASS